MSSFLPPSERNWWSTPVGKQEVIWVGIALVWCLIMFLMMPYWHLYGKQNLSSEAYQTTPERFQERVDEMVAKYTIREESGIPVVKPPAGSEVYMLGRQFEWWPVLEFQKGKSYRLHLSAADVQHGFSLQPENINLQIHPGYEMVITITPTRTGTFGVVCNEYCGLGHHQMTGRIIVVDK